VIRRWRSSSSSGWSASSGDGTRVRIVNRDGVPLEMPLTGVAVGEEQLGSGPGWIRVPPGGARLERRPLVVGG
jgi:hypothetical protein